MNQKPEPELEVGSVYCFGVREVVAHQQVRVGMRGWHRFWLRAIRTLRDPLRKWTPDGRRDGQGGKIDETYPCRSDYAVHPDAGGRNNWIVHLGHCERELNPIKKPSCVA